MKLEWLASVLRPSDIVPGPTSGDPNYASRPHVVLAAAIDGDPWPRPPLFQEDRPTESYDSEEVDAVDLAVKSFFADTQRAAATSLVELLLGGRLDLAATAALSLVATTALADLEDRPMFERLLTSVLDRVKGADSSTKLLRVALLQQLSLRRQDWGSTDTNLTEEAYNLLRSIEKTAQFPDFRISPASSEKSSRTISHIIAALRYSVVSMLPNSMSITKVSDSPIDASEVITAAKSSEEVLVTHWDRATEYARYVETYFNRLYGDRSTRIGGTVPDLFYVNLRNELYGSESVYATRKQLALLRLVEVSSMSAQHDQAECLRLLRYGQGDDHLALALNRLSLGGPLSSLSQDARQVIARRLTSGYVRSEDLQVLEAGADLLTVSEAQDALAAIFRLLDAGSPTNDPGRWSAPFSRIDRTWRAAAALAAPANAVDEVSARLLRDVRSSRYDEALDMAFARNLMRLELGAATEEQTAEWREWLDSPSRWRYTADTARSMLGIRLTTDDTGAIRKSDVEAVVSDLLRDQPVSQEIKAKSADVVSDALLAIRSSAQQGRYSSGGAEPAELAVVLITFGENQLWAPLSEYVLDTAVPRQKKTGALDRLANSTPPIPSGITAKLRERADDLLLTRDANPIGGDPLQPYPAALRFLAAYDLILDEDLVIWLGQLAGSQAPRARIEAAKTISRIVSPKRVSWLITMALQLSYETEAEIQGYASSAMATMVSFPSEGRGAAIRRLLALMESDSLIAPLLAIRGLAAQPTNVDERLRSGVERLMSRHPSRRVRTEAANLIRASTGHTPA